MIARLMLAAFFTSFLIGCGSGSNSAPPQTDEMKAKATDRSKMIEATGKTK